MYVYFKYHKSSIVYVSTLYYKLDYLNFNYIMYNKHELF